jgi:hypothetical protein
VSFGIAQRSSRRFAERSAGRRQVQCRFRNARATVALAALAGTGWWL